MRVFWALCLAIVFTVAAASAQERIPNAVYMPFSDAVPILRADASGLPAPLRGADLNRLRAMWPEWEVSTDNAIRQRLIADEEDTLAEELLFGTSFTDQPRAKVADVDSIGTGHPSRVVVGRVTDILAGLTDPSGNERLVFWREMLLDRGYSFESPAAQQKVREYLIANLRRVRQEKQLYDDAIAAAQQLSAPAETARGTGIAISTSLLTNYGLEEALTDLRTRGLLAGGSVHNVAVIGPGLDFIDRQSGYDTYPQQTIQPFAVLDSLFRLKLAQPDDVRILTFDISRRVNAHIDAAREKAAQGRPYILQLPRDEKAGWTAGAIAYWTHFGETTGDPATPAELPKELKDVAIHAVRVDAKYVNEVAPVDLDIVLQQLDVPTDAPAFDLIVSTNVLNYYDAFGQNLALRNIARMLRPGGILLTNGPLQQMDGAQFQLAGTTKTQYSTTESDTDYWYQRVR